MRRRHSSRRYLQAFLISLVLSIVAAVSSWFHEVPDGAALAGPFQVVDGDTLTFHRKRLRLSGLDAPELAQRCGAGATVFACGVAAKDGLSQRLDGQTTCRGSGRDRYRRLLVRCTNGSGDIGRALVLQGLAVSYGAYAREEADARAARRGLWAGPFERPADWRKAQRREGDGDMSLRDWIGTLWQ